MKRVALLAAIAAVASSAPRRASAFGTPSSYDNEFTYPVGGRAAGMAGAYTALGCDEGAVYYDPAALACSRESRIEISANAYMLTSEHLRGAFGKGQDVSSTRFLAVPTLVDGARVVIDGNPETGAGRLVLGFAVSSPSSQVSKVDTASNQVESSVAYSLLDQLTTLEGGIGYQVNRYLSIGGALSGSMRNYEVHDRLLVIPRDLPGCSPGICNPFLLLDQDSEALAVGLRAKLAVRITPTPRSSIAMVLTSPSLDLFGSSTFLETAGASIDAANFSPLVGRFTGKSDLGLPLRLALGGAYRWDHFLLSLDASINAPHQVALLHDLHPELVFPIGAVGSPGDVIYRYSAQPNVRVGAEVDVVRGFSFAFGAFTNLSAVREQDAEAGTQTRVHQFGGTIGVGYGSEKNRGFLSLAFQMGQAKVPVPSGRLNLDNVINDRLPNDALGKITRWSLIGGLGSRFAFPTETKGEGRRIVASSTPSSSTR